MLMLRAVGSEARVLELMLAGVTASADLAMAMSLSRRAVELARQRLRRLGRQLLVEMSSENSSVDFGAERLLLWWRGAASTPPDRRPKEFSMLIGQTILVPGVASPGAFYSGAWMQRQGDSFLMVVQIIKASLPTGWSLKVTAQTKNAEDADPALSAAGLANFTMTSAGTGSTLVSGCKELVRLVFNAVATGGQERWLHLRANPPIWRPN